MNAKKFDPARYRRAVLFTLNLGDTFELWTGRRYMVVACGPDYYAVRDLYSRELLTLNSYTNVYVVR